MIYTVTLNPALDYDIYLNKLILGSLNEAKENNIRAGGKGINVSIMLNNLNEKSIALGFLSGFTGNYIKDDLVNKDIENNFIWLEKEVDTRINIKINDDEDETEISGLSPNISLEKLEDLKKILKNCTEKDMLVLSGSIPKSLKTTVYKELSECFKGDVFLDTRGKNIKENLSKNTIFIKPNINELREIYGFDDLNSIEEVYNYTKDFFNYGIKHIIVSDGANGAYYFNIYDEYGYKIKSPKGDYVNSIGSGDSMVAGFIYGMNVLNNDNEDKIIKINSFIDCFKLSVACGSATAFSYNIAQKDMVLKLFNDVKVEKIKVK